MSGFDREKSIEEEPTPPQGTPSLVVDYFNGTSAFTTS